MVALDGLGLAFAFTSTVADSFQEAVNKALAASPELALVLRAGIIATVFIVSYFQQEHDAWARLLESFSNPDFLTAWAVAGAMNVAANFLIMVGMQRGKLSDTLPYLSLSPVFLLVSGYFILDEVADGKGMAGVLIIAIGSFWLSRAGVTDEAKPTTENVQLHQKSIFAALPPGAGIYIVIAMIQSISSAYDKRGVRAAAAPILYGATINATVCAFAFLKFAWQQWKTYGAHAMQSPTRAASASPATFAATKLGKEESEESSLKASLCSSALEGSPSAQPANVRRRRSSGQSPKVRCRSSPFLLSYADETDDMLSSPLSENEIGKTNFALQGRMMRSKSSVLMVSDVPNPVKAAGVRLKRTYFANHSKRCGLMLLGVVLKMTGYWCQLKANERIYSAHLSAIRKSGVLLILLLGRVLYDEKVGNKLLPVGIMLVGVAILAAAK
eukprot:gnl/TRDRNA2_/TRDRNA2_162015_c0_seq1.p1 gnl/TRDRNA2_/TRDRNA2_162015_c0~~gnl/TRDRNA2_/TRDRNA2_162015_c0_seq1.p1  ORF type:complete len:443 (+),score=57.65 gnl/TRDRNA2_/TRDRNA2_162015_c0_seq1:47-1375(+)